MPSPHPPWRIRLLQATVTLAMPYIGWWAWRQERHILRAGRPLFSSEWSAAVRVGVRHPEKVRILTVEAIPMPGLRWMHRLAARLGYDPRHVGGLCLRYGILLRRDLAAQPIITTHELVHTAQFERHRHLTRFLHLYLQQCLTHGYAHAPLEKEAVLKSQPLS